MSINKYRCPQNCKKGDDYYNLEFNYGESTDNEIVLECQRCGVQKIFKRIEGLYKTVVKKERVKCDT